MRIAHQTRDALAAPLAPRNPPSSMDDGTRECAELAVRLGARRRLRLVVAASHDETRSSTSWCSRLHAPLAGNRGLASICKKRPTKTDQAFARLVLATRRFAGGEHDNSGMDIFRLSADQSPKGKRYSTTLPTVSDVRNSDRGYHRR